MEKQVAANGAPSLKGKEALVLARSQKSILA